MLDLFKLPRELLYSRMRQLRNSSPKEFPSSSRPGRSGFSLPRSCPPSWTACQVPCCSIPSLSEEKTGRVEPSLEPGSRICGSCDSSLWLTSPGAGSGALQPWGECKGAKPWACLAAYGLIRCLFAVQRARAEDHPLENGMSKHHRQVVKDSEGMSRASHASSRACARRWSGTIGEDRADARLAVQTGTMTATIRRVTT